MSPPLNPRIDSASVGHSWDADKSQYQPPGLMQGVRSLLRARSPSRLRHAPGPPRQLAHGRRDALGSRSFKEVGGLSPSDVPPRPAWPVFHALAGSPYADYMERQQAEGWYLDPYQIHHDRWMSAGRPTKLVRDGQTESYDAPPDLPLPAVLVHADSADDEPATGSDLRRADEAGDEPPYSARKARRAVIDYFEQLPRK